MRRFLIISMWFLIGSLMAIGSHLEAGSDLHLPQVTLNQSTSFLGSDGDTIEVPSGTYTVEQANNWIRLQQDERRDAIILQASPLTHIEPVTHSQAILKQHGFNEFQLMLLLPDGTGLTVTGQSQLTSRGISALARSPTSPKIAGGKSTLPQGLGSASAGIPQVTQARPTVDVPTSTASPLFEATYLPSFKGTRMLEGRVSRLPVSAFHQQIITSTTGLELRTRCLGENDTGMIVDMSSNPMTDTLEPIPRGLSHTLPPTRLTTLYNDDHPSAEGNHLGSYICATCQSPAPPTSIRATVYVFSQRRATAYCTLEKKEPTGWQPLTNPPFQHFGGTLVDVGPLQPHDYLEVQTQDFTGWPDYQAKDYDTRMLLFQPTSPANGLLYNENARSDRDPKIVIPNSAWSHGSNYVLLGKSQPHTQSNKGVEVNIDLVRGPLNHGQSSHTFGTSHLLSPGRYYVWLYAKTTSPVGTPTPKPHSSADMNRALENGFTCPPIITPKSSTKNPQLRGTLNSRAFDFRIIAKQNGAWTERKRRTILKGQMGAKAGDLNLFLMDLDVPIPTEIAVEVQHPTQDVEFFPQWRVMRNPDASDFTVASFNTLYDSGSPHARKTRNAANLLASRGMIQPGTGAILEPTDQAPWQWDADLIGLQELRDGDDDGFAEYFYADVFAREAMQMGSRSWNVIRGQDEDFPNAVATDGRGPVFITEHLWRSGNANNIFLPNSLLKKARCKTYDRTNEYECALEDGASDFVKTFGIPGQISIPRYRSVTASGQQEADRPIMVVNLHLADGSSGWLKRRNQLNNLMTKLRTFLKENPSAFNSEGKNHPHHYQNRILLLGDFNWSAHHCGEHYWFLHTLREAFGYAVDVSMAANDNDMHDRMGAIGSNGIPQNWESAKSWKKDPSRHTKFPWWMTTHRGKAGNLYDRNERYDAMMLVGAGWAYDDPVREYEVLWDRNGNNPLNGDSKGGVEMADTGNLVTQNGYRPQYALKCRKPSCEEEDRTNSTKPGDPALDSDHLPIRARLRVFIR